jgi:hypothetical protein
MLIGRLTGHAVVRLALGAPMMATVGAVTSITSAPGKTVVVTVPALS